MATYEEYLEEKATEFGFHEKLRHQWINYAKNDVERGNVLTETLFDEIGLMRYQSALDIGSGFGGQCVALKSRFERVYGIECIKERVQWSVRRAPECSMTNGNAVELPFQKGVFDFVVSIDVFEHISGAEQHEAAGEIWRVLKTDGKAYLEVPNRFQILDEHNKVWFGTYLPPTLRRSYTKAFSKNKKYLQCWERSQKGWQRLFHSKGFKTTIVPYGYAKAWLPPSRFKIYLEKGRRS